MRHIAGDLLEHRRNLANFELATDANRSIGLRLIATLNGKYSTRLAKFPESVRPASAGLLVLSKAGQRIREERLPPAWRACFCLSFVTPNRPGQEGIEKIRQVRDEKK